MEPVLSFSLYNGQTGTSAFLELKNQIMTCVFVGGGTEVIGQFILLILRNHF